MYTIKFYFSISIATQDDLAYTHMTQIARTKQALLFGESHTFSKFVN